jgi:hypothetical protein
VDQVLLEFSSVNTAVLGGIVIVVVVVEFVFLSVFLVL